MLNALRPNAAWPLVKPNWSWRSWEPAILTIASSAMARVLGLDLKNAKWLNADEPWGWMECITDNTEVVIIDKWSPCWRTLSVWTTPFQIPQSKPLHWGQQKLHDSESRRQTLLETWNLEDFLPSAEVLSRNIGGSQNSRIWTSVFLISPFQHLALLGNNKYRGY